MRRGALPISYRTLADAAEGENVAGGEAIAALGGNSPKPAGSVAELSDYLSEWPD